MEKLNSDINDYIVNNRYYELSSFNNLEFFINLCESLLDIIESISNYNFVNRNDLTKCDLFTQLEHIKNFYKKNNIELDIDKLINDGTIHINFIDDYNLAARNYYDGDNNFKAIDFNYSGHLIDSTSLVHELSHYRNQTDNNRTVINDFMTEGLAFYDELLYGFYLIDNGFIEDGNFVIKTFLDICYLCVGDNLAIFKIIHLFNTLGSVNEENYKLLYNDEYYEDSAKFTKGILEDSKNKYLLYKNLYYTYGYYVVLNLFDKYFDKDYSEIDRVYSTINDMDYLNLFGDIDKFNKDKYTEESKKVIKKVKNTYKKN